MKKDVEISINTKRIPKNDDPEEISTTVRGTAYTKDDLLYITYKENPEEFGKTLTTVKIKDGRVELIRNGNVTSRLVFRPNLPYEGSYNTPYGSLPLKVAVNDMDLQCDDNQGTVIMNYSLNFAGDETENIFTLKYKCI